MLKQRSKSVFTALLAALLIFCGVVCLSGPAFAENTLVKLGEYAEYTIPENMDHSAEYSMTNGKRLDYGIRIPAYDASGNITNVLGGDPMTHPGANGGKIGNGVNVDYGVAKLSMVYAGGGARFRYGYGVDLKNTNINLNMLDMGGINGHLNLTFTSSYNSLQHPQINEPGVSLIIYQDSATDFQCALLTSHGSAPVDGLISTNDNNNVMNFPVSAEDPDSYCFSIYTWQNEDGSWGIQVIHQSGQITYTVPASYTNELVIGAGDPDYSRSDKGMTNISINASDPNWNDNIGIYLTYVIEIKDTYRTAYEEEILNPIRNALESYLKVLDETSISTIEEVDGWLQKRAAIDTSKTAQLRIGDRDFMQLDAKLAQADAKVQELAGTLVNTYVSGRVNELETSFAALTGEGYTDLTTRDELAVYTTLFTAVNQEVTQDYATVISATEEELAAYQAALVQARNLLEVADTHLTIYEVEHMDMSDAEKIVAAKAAYAKINTEDFRAAISALNTEDSVKSALTGRLDGIADIIDEAEAQLDPSNIIDTQIANYEAAPIGTIEEIRDALAVKALIGDYSGLEEAADFEARILAKDAAIQESAWTLIQPAVTRVEELTAEGITSYQQSRTLGGAIDAIQDMDLLSEEDKKTADDAIAAGQALIATFQAQLEERGWIIYSGNSEGAEYGDIELKENTVVYSTNGQNAIIYTKAFDLSEGVEVVFTVDQWGYIAGDGTASGSNNSWVCFSDRVFNEDNTLITRSSLGAMSVMYWMAQESFTKGYYNSDQDLTASQMSTIPEGATVVVTLKTNEEKQRFEIETMVYGADGREIAGCYTLMLMSYTEDYNPQTFENGVYVSFGCWMDTRADFYNIWEIESVGQTGDWEAPQVPDEPENPGDDTPGTSDEPGDNNGGCNGGCGSTVFGGSLAVSALAAGMAAVIRRRRMK